MKVLAETTGNFMLVDGTNLLEAHRPGVITMSAFYQNRISRGHVEMLAKLKDEATDPEFARYVAESDGDMQLAIASFTSTFGIDAPETSKVDQPQPVAPAKPAAVKKK